MAKRRIGASFQRRSILEMRAEVSGTQFRLLLDGQVVAEASDDRLSRGFFYLTLGPGTHAQFDAIEIIAMR